MDIIGNSWTEHSLWLLAAILLLAFTARYLAPSFVLARALKAFSRQLKPAKDLKTGPDDLSPSNSDLRHLWTEYCKTLHAEKSDDGNGVEVAASYRATAPAAAFFNSGSVVDGRISVEFFRHLPGLLTGLGIIGTFHGLITGLDGAYGAGGLDAPVLIAAVRDAFLFSACAITAAMLVTFLEKWRYARLQHLTDKICNEIDQLYHAGVGEEYLERLVKASEQALTNSQQIKDSVIGELRVMLDRLTDRQIEAASHHHSELRIGLLKPMEAVAQGIAEFGTMQGEAIGTGFQDQMSAFAGKLDELLGGQVGQARELQGETVRALEKAVAQFELLAQRVGSAGETATSAMAAQLHQALDGMVDRQSQATETMRAFMDQMRDNAAKSQTDVQQHLTELLQGIGGQMSAIMSGVQRQAEASGEAARSHQQQLSEEAQRTVQGLTAKFAIRRWPSKRRPRPCAVRWPILPLRRTAASRPPGKARQR